MSQHIKTWRDRLAGLDKPTDFAEAQAAKMEAADLRRYIAELERASQPGGGWNALTDEDRKAAFESLPDMLEGFMKKWGWLHFAKEIERLCYEKNQGSQTGRGEDEDGARYRFLRDECNLSVRDVFGSWCQQLNDGMDAAVDAARASLDGRRES